MTQYSSLRRGFTLIELSIVLVMVSLMVGFGMKAVTVPQGNDCIATTRAQLTSIRSAMDRFVQANARFPIPAGRSLALSDANSGREASATTSSTIDRLAAANPVAYGALPYQALGLPSSFASDCWGNKFSYMVTESLTSSNATTGLPSLTTVPGLTVKTGTLSSSNVLSNNIAYAVISHGASAVGGVSRNYSGASHGWCSVGTAIDTENCDANNVNVFLASFNNGASAGSNFFDDLLIFGGKPIYSVTNGGGSYSGCNSASVNWGSGCSAAVGAMSHLQTLSASNTVSGYSGTATVTCTDGTLTATGSCGASCPGQSTGWSGNTAGCSGNVGALNHGDSAGVTNGASGRTGSATATCNDGNVTSSGSCDLNCSAGTATWNTNCSQAVAAMNSGTSQSVTNTNNGYTGTATVSCNNSNLSITGGTCTSNGSLDCAATTVSWTGGCSAAVGALTNGNSSGALTNTASGHTGTATATCSSGTVTASGSCHTSCSTQTVPWLTNCSASVTGMNHGDAVTPSSSASGYTGGATVTCNEGTYTVTGASCTANTSCTDSVVYGSTCDGHGGGGNGNGGAGGVCMSIGDGTNGACMSAKQDASSAVISISRGTTGSAFCSSYCYDTCANMANVNFDLSATLASASGSYVILLPFNSSTLYSYHTSTEATALNTPTSSNVIQFNLSDAASNASQSWARYCGDNSDGCHIDAVYRAATKKLRVTYFRHGGKGNQGGSASSSTFPLNSGYSGSDSWVWPEVRVMKAAPPTCGTAQDGYSSSAPSSGLCGTGTASAVSLSGLTYSWTCSNSGGGSCTAYTTNCSANKLDPAGACMPGCTVGNGLGNGCDSGGGAGSCASSSPVNITTTGFQAGQYSGGGYSYEWNCGEQRCEGADSCFYNPSGCS